MKKGTIKNIASCKIIKRGRKIMAKGWKVIASSATNYGDSRTRDEKKRDSAKQSRTFNRMIKNITSKKEEEIVKEIEDAYNAKVADEAQLLKAFEDKKLKSKYLIKKAQGLKKKEAATA